MSDLACFRAALAFLTRFPAGEDAGNIEPATALGWFPAVGFCLGVVCALPVWLGVLAGYPLLQGILYVGLSTFLTRGLHWDGLADVCDALGSGKQGDEFDAVLKDSRLGAFGAIGLGIGILLTVLLASSVITRGAVGALVAAPLAGRCVPAIVLHFGPVRGNGLAWLLEPGADADRAKIAAAMALIAAWASCGFLGALELMVVGGFGLFWLRRQAIRHGGVNGDFVGASVILVEACVLTCAL